MQKKILASLLVTPLAFNAMADITVNDGLQAADGWTQSGITGTSIFTENGVNCPIAGGYIQRTLNLLPGDYRLTFTGATGVQVKIGDEVVTGTDGVYEFKVDGNAAKEVTLVVEPAANNGFSFSTLKLELVFDFEGAAQALTANLPALTILKNEESSFTAEYTKLATEKKAIEDAIATLTDKNQANAYETQKMWLYLDGGDNISVRIEALKEAAEAYNEKADADNIKPTNDENYEYFLGENGLIEHLRKELKDINQVIDTAQEGLSTDVSAYVDEQQAAKTTEMEKAITTCETEIKSMFDSAGATTLVEKADAEEKYNEVKERLSEYGENYTTWIADAEAYYQLMDELDREWKPGIIQTYNEQLSRLFALKGIEGYENAFTEVNTGWQSELATEKDEAEEAATKATADGIEGCAAKYEDAAETIIADAKTAMKEIANDAEDKVAKQNDFMKSALETIAGLQPKSSPSGIKEELDEVVGDITALKTSVENAYSKLELPVADFDTKVNEIEEKLAPIQDIINLQTQYDNLAENIEKNVDTVDIIAYKFSGSMESIANSLGNLTLENYGEFKDGINDAITVTETNVQNLLEAYDAASKALEYRWEAINSITGEIDKIKLFDGAESTVFNDLEKTYYDGPDERFKGVKDSNNAQEAFNTLTALKDELDGNKEAFDEAVAGVLAQYASDAEAANKDVVNAKYTDVEKAAEGEYYGKTEDVDSRLATIKTKLDNIPTDVAATEEDIPAAANKIYDKLYEVLCDLSDPNDPNNGLESDIAKYKSNQNWATAQNNALTDIVNFIADAQETNGDTSLEPARSYFKEAFDNLTDQVATLTADVKTALEKGIAEGNITADDREDIETKIDALRTDVNTTYAQITKNHDAYTALLEDAESTRKQIQDVIDGLQTLIDESGNPDETATGEWTKALADTMDSLTVVNRELGDVYGQGIADKKKNDLTAKYAGLLKQAGEIQAEYTGKFDGLVATANRQWRDKWVGMYQELRGNYLNAIDAFNAYSSATLTNTDYFNYLKENVVVKVDGEDKKVLGDHEPIHKYSAQITALNSTVTDFINAQNVAKKVISQEEFDKQTENSYSEAMQRLVDAMKKAAAEVAFAYYNTIIDKAQDIVDTAKGIMQNAGVSADIIDTYTEDAQTAINTQKDFYDKSSDGSSDVVVAVNAIANDLDKIAIDTTAAAQKEWARALGDDKTELKIMAGEIAGFKYVQDDENIEVFNRAKDAVYAMTTPAGLDDLKDALSGLDEQMETARNAHSALSVKNQAADITSSKLMPEVENLTKENEALEEFADGLAATPANSDIAGDIDAIKSAIEASTDIVEDEPAIRTLIDNVRSDIENGYTSLVANENAILNDLMSQIRLAYNNARAAGKLGTDEEANEKNEEINNLQSDVYTLYNENKGGVTDSYKDDALALEKTLTDELIDLQSRVNTDTTLNDVLTALNELYSTTYSAVEAGKAAVGELVKDEYEPQYQELLDTLEGIRSAIDNDGNQVLLHKDSFESRINAVADKLETLNADAATAQEEAEAKAKIEAATEANKTALEAELEAVSTALTTAKDKVTGWEVDEWGVLLGTLDKRLATIKEAIDTDSNISETNPDGITDEEKAAHSTAIASVTTEMDYYLKLAALDYAERARTATNGDISAARRELAAAATVVNSAGLSERISAQTTALETLVNEKNAAIEAAEDDAALIVEAYENFVEGTEAIREAVAAIRGEIVENTYVTGDVNSDGESDVADLQVLLKWIGEGMTLEQVNETYGAASAAAADVNGNGNLNITDGTALIQIISDVQGNGGRRIIARRGVMESDNVFGLVRSGEEQGSRIYSLFLNNTALFTGAQVDIKLPAGMTLTDAAMSERAAGHEVQIFDNGNGNYRLLIFSMANATFEGTSGELVRLTIEGIGNPVATDMILADPGHNAVQGKTADTTMLESLMESAHNVKERIYNAAGQSLRAVQRGINIIRRSDGTTSKEMHK